jgi:hypothetical protein
MTVIIATVQTFEEAAQVVTRVWADVGKSHIIRFEAFDGMGKSGLAQLVAAKIGAEHVEVDKFAFKPELQKPYRDCLRKEELDAKISEVIASRKPVILDAVCLDEVAPRSQWGRGFVVYIKRLSFNNPDPTWHEGFGLEDEETPTDEPHRGVFLYHQRSKPHQRADLIIEIPDLGHRILNFSFDRRKCFDPPGAKVLPYRGSQA